MDGDFIKIAKAISDKTRVRVLKLLENGELCVCQLMKILGMKQSTISKHLGILKNAGLIENRKDSTWAFYRLSRNKPGSHNKAFLRLLSSTLEDDPTVLADRKALKKQEKEDVKELCA